MDRITPDIAAERIRKLAALKRQVEAEMSELAGVIDRNRRAFIPRRSRFEVPECGTETAYQRHHHRGEKCDPCRVAHAEHTKQAQRERRARLAEIAAIESGAA